MSGEYLIEGTAITLLASLWIRSGRGHGGWTLLARDGRAETWLRDHDLNDKLFETRREAARAFEAAAHQQDPPAPMVMYELVTLTRLRPGVYGTAAGRITVTARDDTPPRWDINGLDGLHPVDTLYQARERITAELTRIGENPHEW